MERPSPAPASVSASAKGADQPNHAAPGRNRGGGARAPVDAAAVSSKNQDEWKTVTKPRRKKAPPPVIATQTTPIRKADAVAAVALPPPPPPPIKSPAITQPAPVGETPPVITYTFPYSRSTRPRLTLDSNPPPVVVAHTPEEPEKEVIAETSLPEEPTSPPVPVKVRPGDPGRLPGLAQLPTDILPLIFVPVCSSSVGMLARVRLTCRAWRTFVSRLPIVVRFTSDRRFTWGNSNLVTCISEQVPRLTGVRGWRGYDMRPLVPFASQLTTLGVTCMDWPQLAVFLEWGAALTTLSIDQAPLLKWHSWNRRPPLPCSLASLTSLRSLTLKHTMAKPPVCEWVFPPSLTSLTLDHYAVSCGTLPNLRFLTVKHLHARYESFIKKLLSGSPALQHVTLLSFNSYPGTDFVACPSVEVVNMRDCHWRLEHIVSHFPNVRFLTLSLLHPPADPVGELRRLERLVLDERAAPVSWIAQNIECFPALRHVTAPPKPLAELRVWLTEFGISHIALHRL